jgi:magnesium chelatase family protein
VVDGVDVLGVGSLDELAAWLHGTGSLSGPEPSRLIPERSVVVPGPVLAAPVQRAVEIAAAGGFHVLLHSPRGIGVLLIAHWLRALLPELTADQQREAAVIQSVLGPRKDGSTLVTAPPTATFHHNGSLATLIGGGQPDRLGAVTRAHHGVLVAPDLHEYSRAHAEALRTTLIEREVRLVHGGAMLTYPARFQLCATIDRCACGPVPGTPCTCTPRQHHRFRTRLPQPVLDLVHIGIPLSGTFTDPAASDDPGHHRHVLDTARARVAAARTRAADRWRCARANEQPLRNCDVPAEQLHAITLPAEVTKPIDHALRIGTLSRRGAVAVRQLGWTIADLARDERPNQHQVLEALRLRQVTTTNIPVTTA